MLKELEKAYPLVRSFLKKYKDTREDDRKLMLRIWEFQGLILSEDQKHKFLNTILHPESIRRCRQKVQEEGEFLPENPQGRLFAEDQIKKWTRNA